MPSNSYDLVILGGGTGGYSAALRGAGLGLKVALVERDKVGGTCLHRGCIPTKALLHAGELADGVREAAERWGMKAAIESIDYSATVANREDIVTRNFKGLESHLKKEKVEVVSGNGKVTGPRQVDVEGVGQLTAERALVLASGSTPKSLPGLVPLEDEDIQRELGRAFRRRGINAMVDTKLEDTKVSEDQVTITVTNQGRTSEISAELLLVATGRGPVTDGLGYQEIGVQLDRGYVTPANWDTLETAAAGVYAVGDLLPPPSLALAHASFAEGMQVAELAAGLPSPPIDYAGVPRVTYCSPEVASVGLTERQARDAGHEVVTNRFPFNGVARGMMYGQGGIVKLVAAKDGPVLGVHLIGARVTELIAEAMLVYNWEALPADVAQFIHPHPTLSEAVGEAYLTLAGRPLHQG